MFFFDTYNAVTAREDRKPKYWRLGHRHLRLSLTLWRHNVKLKVLPTVQCYLNRLCETLKRFFWFIQEINKRRNMEINNHKSYSRCRVWRCDVTTSNSIQDGGALVVNILVFDLRVQLQHSTYQRKTLLFALIKVSTFICKREILGFSSPLSNFSKTLTSGPQCHTVSEMEVMWVNKSILFTTMHASNQN